MSVLPHKRRIDEISEFLTGTLSGKSAILGVSGGIDSALVLMLLARSVGRESIVAVFMPDNGTPERDFRDIGELSKASGVEISTINIQPMVDAFTGTLHADDKRAIGNIKSRVRMATLYYHSNTRGGMVVGTTNRSENLIGYFTKYGDGGCDVEPIIGLYKTEVRKISPELNVPISIIEKKPSAGLWENQFDEDEMGITYDELDTILSDLFDRNTGIISDRHRKVHKMYLESRHKRRMPLAKEN